MSGKIRKPFKALTVTEGDNEATMRLYGYIGDAWNEDGPTTDENFANTLEELASKYDTIHVRINSPGGSFQHGNAMITAIRQHADKVHTYIDGIAASMAADIFLAAKKGHRHVAKNSHLMVHATMDSGFTNAAGFRKLADDLDRFDEAAIDLLAESTGKSPEKIKETYYDGADHWLTAKEMKKEGIVEKIDDYKVVTPPDPAKMTKSQWQNFFMRQQEEEVPQPSLAKALKEALSSIFKSKTETPSPELNEAEMTLEELRKAIADGTISADDVSAVLADTKKETNDGGDDATTRMEKMLADLKAANDDLRKKVEEIEALPGTQPASTEGGEAAGEPAKTELQKFNERMADSAKVGFFPVQRP